MKVLAWRRLGACGDSDGILGIAMIEKEEKEKKGIAAFGEGHFFFVKNRKISCTGALSGAKLM